MNLFLIHEQFLLCMRLCIGKSCRVDDTVSSEIDVVSNGMVELAAKDYMMYDLLPCRDTRSPTCSKVTCYPTLTEGQLTICA